MVLNGFVDDSGSGKGSGTGNVYVLAGFVSTVQLWEEFSDEWERICSQPPCTPNFKMAEAFRFQEYRWSEPERDKRISELVDLIKRKALYRVDAVLAHPNYDNLVRGKLPAEIDDPYFLLFYQVILSFISFINQAGIPGTVDWVFDDQSKLGNECAKFYDWLKSNTRPEIADRLGSRPIFRHDSDVLPLKAADIFAWQIRRHLNQEQPQGLPANDILHSLLSMYGVSNNMKGEHLAVALENLDKGINLKASAQFLLPPESQHSREENGR